MVTTSEEFKLYPKVESWMKNHFLCFKTGINKGLKHGRIDVIGIRDIGNDLSGEVETIAIEVKRGIEPFATACGQAFGYNVYANRVYLAESRDEHFGYEEKKIAGHLGVGLIQIEKNGKCKEIASSPTYVPLMGYNLMLLEKLAIGKCQMCGSFFEIGDAEKSYSKLSKENLDRAIKNDKGIMFFNTEVADRKAKLGLRVASDGLSYERRFVCADCIYYFFLKDSK